MQVYAHPQLRVSLCVYCYEGVMGCGNQAAHKAEPEVGAEIEIQIEMSAALAPPTVQAVEGRAAARLLLPFAGGPLGEGGEGGEGGDGNGGGEGGALDGLYLRALAPRDGVVPAGAAASSFGALPPLLPDALQLTPATPTHPAHSPTHLSCNPQHAQPAAAYAQPAATHAQARYSPSCRAPRRCRRCRTRPG